MKNVFVLKTKEQVKTFAETVGLVESKSDRDQRIEKAISVFKKHPATIKIDNKIKN